MFPNIETLANFSFCGVSPLDQNNPSSLALSPITLFMSFPWWDGVQYWFQTYTDRNTLTYWVEAGWNLVQTLTRDGSKFPDKRKEVRGSSSRESRGPNSMFTKCVHTYQILYLFCHFSPSSLSQPVTLFKLFETSSLFLSNLDEIRVFPFYHILGLGPR